MQRVGIVLAAAITWNETILNKIVQSQKRFYIPSPSHEAQHLHIETLDTHVEKGDLTKIFGQPDLGLRFD